MSVYVGKFNVPQYASNENMFVVFMDGWVERGRVFVFSTFTVDAYGVEKRAFDLTTAYVLQASAHAKTFTIRDLDEKAYYWFNGIRNDETNITLTMKEGPNIATIELAKLAN